MIKSRLGKPDRTSDILHRDIRKSVLTKEPRCGIDDPAVDVRFTAQIIIYT
jgi:hypothetical protein